MKDKDYYNIYREKIETLCADRPDKNVIYYMKDGGSRRFWNYSEFLRGLKAVEKILKRLGTVRGDRVAVIIPHSPHAVIAGMGIAYAGRTGVYIDSSLPVDEIMERIEFTDVTALFIAEEMMDALSSVIGGIKHIYPVICAGASQADFAHMKGSAERIRGSSVQDQDTDVIAILFSSGTTGRTKGIMLTYRSIVEALPVFAVMGRTKKDSSYMCLFPFNHVSGYDGAMINFLNGHELGMLEKPEPSKYIRAFLEFNPVNISLTAGVYDIIRKKIETENGRAFFYFKLRLSDFFRKYFGINAGKWLFKRLNKRYFGNRLEFIGMGGGPVPAELAKFYLALGFSFENVYSSTELGFAAAVAGVNDRYPIGSEGRVDQFDNINIRIVGRESDGSGEIRVKSPLVMKGYFREPRKTADAFDSYGYFRTGDLGYIDGRGYLHLTGRANESIILRTGRKTAAEDVDRYYRGRLSAAGMKGDIALASRGMRDEDGYDSIYLFIEGKGLSEEEKERILRTVKAESVKAPDIYRICEAYIIPGIPRTQIGKIQRYMLEIPENHRIKAESQPYAGYKENENDNDNKNGDAAEKRSRKETDDDDEVNSVLRVILRSGSGISYDDKAELYYDLGMDSLGLYEMCVMLEERTGRALEDNMHSRITVGDVRNLLKRGTAAVPEPYFDVSRYPVKRSPRLDNKLSRLIRAVRFVYSLDVKGTENVPDEPCIICANHQSFFDCLFLLSAIGEDKFKKDKLTTLVASSAQEKHTEQCNMVGSIPVDRGGNTAPAIKRIKQCIEDGYTAVIFPEGRMSDDGSIGEFKQGAARLAAETGSPVLPVRIRGAFDIFPKTSKRPNIFDRNRFRRYRVTVSIGKPINGENISAAALTAEIQRAVERL